MRIKKSVLLLGLVALLALMMVVAGCGGKAPAPTTPSTPGEPADPKADWPARISLGTAGTGGVYFIYGGWGNLVSEVVGIDVGIEQTGGPADNMMLVHDGANDMGMITMGIGWEGWTGQAGTAFAGTPHTNVRALFPMYSTFAQFWAHKNSGITGKRVGVGPTGGTPGTYHPLILKLLGINATPVWAALGDLVESHQDNQIDANSFSSGIPVAGVLNYAATVGSDNVVFFGVDGEARDKVMKEYPYWTKGTIPAATYDFINKDIETINVFNWAIVHKDLPASLVYEIVDAVMTNNARMVEIHGAAVETLPENVVTNTFLPLHPGAYQWFVDNGYAVPDGAKPID